VILIKDRNRYFGTSILVLSSLLYFFLAFKSIKKLNKQLGDYEALTSVIVKKGIGFRRGSKGKKTKCFFVYLENLQNQKLGVYRFSKNYTDLEDALQIGDTVSVHFIDKPDRGENINIDLIQLEKNRVVVLPKSEYDNKEKRFVLLMITVGLVSILLGYLYFKREIFKNN
jgi:hypothetical protein